MIRIKNISVSFVLLFWCSVSFAQDPQFSQYYNAPLFLNPAFAGTGQNTRAAMNYRVQWPNQTTPFMSYAASIDHYMEPKRSGFGLTFRRDKEGDAGFRNTDIGLTYSYHVNFTDKWVFIPAVQASFVTRDVDVVNMTFGDQIDNRGFTGGASAEMLGSPRNSYVNFSTGGLIYNENLWFGFSAFNLTRPDQSLLNTGERLPIRYSVHGGYKIDLAGRTPGYKRDQKEKSIIPSFFYMKQGIFDRLDLGGYAVYDPLMFGFWYRGVPFLQYEQSLWSHESLVFMLGFRLEDISVTYSYDFTISKLMPASGGGHEISILYNWEVFYGKQKRRRKPGKRKNVPPCPFFPRAMN
ncbi:MAG: type IX secretion system membrane protein PorP/SprF [Cytophagaceae bacterium]